MTLRDHQLGPPEMLVMVGSREDAEVLAALTMLDDEVRTTLVATGPDPMLVDEVLDDLGAPAGRILLPEGDLDLTSEPARQLAGLLPRLDSLVGEPGVAAVVVRGGSPTALAAAQAAAWRSVPLIAVPAPDDSRIAAANRAVIAELSSWQTSAAGATPFPARLDLLVHQRVGDTVAPQVVGMGAARPGPDVPPGLSA